MQYPSLNVDTLLLTCELSDSDIFYNKHYKLHYGVML